MTTTCGRGRRKIYRAEGRGAATLRQNRALFLRACCVLRLRALARKKARGLLATRHCLLSLPRWRRALSRTTRSRILHAVPSPACCCTFPASASLHSARCLVRFILAHALHHRASCASDAFSRRLSANAAPRVPSLVVRRIMARRAANAWDGLSVSRASCAFRGIWRRRILSVWRELAAHCMHACTPPLGISASLRL